MNSSLGDASVPRTVEIRPPSLRTETAVVVRLAAAIVVLVGFYLANTAWNVDPRAARAAGLLPFQTLVADAPFADQRMFRELQEGLLEAERLRTSAGAWPSPAALADAGIPPFAVDPTVKGPAYHWMLTHRGAYVNYRGTPRAPDAPSWLVHVQEPVPGGPPDPSPEDEEHHRLPGGIVLHVAIWRHANGERLSPALIPLPQNEGWIQLRVNAPTSGYLPPPAANRP
jgi:hypothetical protein